MPWILLWLGVGIVVFAYHVAILAFVVSAGLAVWSGVLWWYDHPWQTLAYAAGYFLCGALWSCVKWWSVQSDRAREAREAYRLDSGGRLWSDFMASRKAAAQMWSRRDVPWWVAFWPISLVWTVLDNPLRRIVRRIVEELRGVYDRITERVWRDDGRTS